MKVTMPLVIECDDQPPIVDEIACLEREPLTLDTLGLTLAEAKRWQHEHQLKSVVPEALLGVVGVVQNVAHYYWRRLLPEGTPIAK